MVAIVAWLRLPLSHFGRRRSSRVLRAALPRPRHSLLVGVLAGGTGGQVRVLPGQEPG